MTENQTPANLDRLIRITGTQAAGAFTETVFFGIFGTFFGFITIVIVAEIGFPGSEFFVEYLSSRPTLLVYIIASAIIYITLTTAVRTEIEAGLNTPPDLVVEHSDSWFERASEKLMTFITISSYTASILITGGILAYELTQIFPLAGMAVLIAYPYYEYYATVRAVEDVDSADEIDVLLTPAFIGTAVVALGITFLVLPIIGVLRILGIVASMRNYFPSLSGMASSIQATQEHLVFIDRLFGNGRQRIP